MSIIIFLPVWILQSETTRNHLSGLSTNGFSFRTTVRFLSVPTVYGSLQATNSLFVGGFKNSCRLTDANSKNLCAINQEFYILNSILLFKTKNLEQSCAQVWPTNPDLMGTWNQVATASSINQIFTAACLNDIPENIQSRRPDASQTR